MADLEIDLTEERFTTDEIERITNALRDVQKIGYLTRGVFMELYETIPYALQISANCIGSTPAILYFKMDQRAIKADDFVPAFMQRVNKRYGLSIDL